MSAPSLPSRKTGQDRYPFEGSDEFRSSRNRRRIRCEVLLHFRPQISASPFRVRLALYRLLFWCAEPMRKQILLIALLFVSLPLLAGCATGDSWYYPYGPSYFGPETGSEGADSPSGFIGQPRPT